MPFYPNATFILPFTTIRRERQLPPYVTAPEVLVTQGQRIEADEVVLRGARSGTYRVVPMLAALGVKRAEDIDPEWLRVQVGNNVMMEQILAQRGTGRRAQRVLAPVNGLVARIDPERIILQADPEEIEITAIAPGVVTAINGKRSVQIESSGALIQGAWGNGRSAFAQFVEEPQGGLQTLVDETLLTTYRKQILLLAHPLTRDLIRIAQQQEVAGVVAPSMSANLRQFALDSTIAILLTEGFGEQQMAQIVYNLLRDNLNRQMALDAAEPSQWDSKRPEIFIPLPIGGAVPAAPSIAQALAVGALVRLTRAPLEGMIGTVKRVIETPRAVENGLRLAGADVQIAPGKTVFAPIANIELLGRAPDGRG